jgi:hypothetical protein
LSAAPLASALALALVGGCGGATIDPCVGRAGACVGVHLGSDVTPLDQIRITLGGDVAHAQLTPAAPAAPLDFPVRFYVELPAGTTRAHLDFEGLRSSALLAHAAADPQLDAAGHAALDLTLHALGGGGDLAGADFAIPPGADLAGADFAIPPGADLAGADFASPDPSDMAAAPGDMAGTVQFTLQIISLNGAPGGLTFSPPATSCGNACYQYPRGQPFTVTAAPPGGSFFLGWGGIAAVCRQANFCTFSLNQDDAATATFGFAPVNYVFATSTTYTVSQLGANGVNADSLCTGRANAAGLANPTSYKAWLSVTGTSAQQRIASTSKGWSRIDGLPFTVNPGSSGVLYPIALDELGSANNNRVWTGTNGTGGLAGNCGDWSMTSSSLTGYFGYPPEGGPQWTYASTQGCDQPASLYCFSTGVTNNYSTSPLLGARLAFVSRTTWTPGGGLTAADGVCASDATLGGLNGTWRAYLATSTASALSRFSGTAPWRRLDGVVLAPSAATTVLELQSATHLAPLDEDPLGVPVDSTNFAWYGSSTFNCSDWNDGSASSSGFVTSVGRSGYGNTPIACNNARYLFCLQQ